MQHVSVVPILAINLLVFWLVLSIGVIRAGKLRKYHAITVPIWLSLLTVWGLYSKQLGESGWYLTSDFLQTMPMLWIPLIPVMITGLMFILPSFRISIAAIVSQYQTPLIAIHALRILAVGTLIKAYWGIFPVSFAVAVGIPDLLFGLSALVMYKKSRCKGVKPKCFMKWNILGLLAILPGASLVGQMGLPGPWYYFTGLPDARALLEYPMVLAPTLVVPLFLIMNGFMLIYGRCEKKS